MAKSKTPTVGDAVLIDGKALKVVEVKDGMVTVEHPPVGGRAPAKTAMSLTDVRHVTARQIEDALGEEAEIEQIKHQVLRPELAKRAKPFHKKEIAGHVRRGGDLFYLNLRALTPAATIPQEG